MENTEIQEVKRDFIYTIPDRVLHHPILTYLDKHLYMLIRSFMDTTGNAYPSNNWLAQKCGVARRSIITSLNRLLATGLIEKTKDNKGRRYLIIKQNPIIISDIEEDGLSSDPGITTQMPDSDPRITCDSDPGITQLYQNIITTKKHIYAHFETFWKIYPKKKDKKKAQKAWVNNNLDARAEEIIAKLQQQIAEDRAFQDIQYIPHPTTYLNGERWEDDITPKNGAKTQEQVKAIRAQQESQVRAIEDASERRRLHEQEGQAFRQIAAKVMDDSVRKKGQNRTRQLKDILKGVF